MKVLVLASQKGGAGKTTIAAHVGVAAELDGAGPVVLIDTDPQGSLSAWWNSREAETPALASATLAELPEKLAALATAGFKLAVMGCEVNGPREAADADLGISGTPDGFIVFSHGKPVATARTDNLEEVLRAILGTVIAETD